MGRLPVRGRAEVVVDAAPTDVWAVVGDPTRVAEWSHETRQAVWVGGSTSAVVGARFRGTNRLGVSRWSRTNEVVAVDAPHSISWITLPSRLYADSTRWTLTIEPAGTGSRIIQDFEVLKLHPALDRLYYALIPAHRDRSEALRSDLARIGEVAAEPVVDAA